MEPPYRLSTGRKVAVQYRVDADYDSDGGPLTRQEHYEVLLIAVDQMQEGIRHFITEALRIASEKEMEVQDAVQNCQEGQ